MINLEFFLKRLSCIVLHKSFFETHHKNLNKHWCMLLISASAKIQLMNTSKHSYTVTIKIN